MNYPAITIARYTFIEAVKNRLFLLMLIGLICIFGLSQFTGELAITETPQIQGAITGLVLRLFAVFIVSLFVITSMVREFNDKTLEFIISLPIPRYVYFSGKLLGFFSLSVIVAIIVSLPLLLYADFLQLLLWCISLICELFIVTTLCLFCLFTLGQITIAFTVVVAFYLLSRSMSTLLLLSQSPILEATTVSQEFIILLVNAIAYVLPELDSFTQTEWLVYNTGSMDSLAIVAGQTLIYVLLLSCAALVDLYRKEF